MSGEDFATAPDSSADQQLELRAVAGGGDVVWRDAHLAQLRELGRRLALPITYPVEVWLTGGVRLRGRLMPTEWLLVYDGVPDDQVQLTVQGVSFRRNELESCVRLD